MIVWTGWRIDATEFKICISERELFKVVDQGHEVVLKLWARPQDCDEDQQFDSGVSGEL